MVKIGFIVEGATEKIILESSDFFAYLKSLSVNFISDIIDAEGSGKLLPQNIGDLLNYCFTKNLRPQKKQKKENYIGKAGAEEEN